MRRTDYNLPIFEDSDMGNLNVWTEETAEALKVQIDKFGFPLVYKGTVATLEDLPESDVGSIYSVTSENKNYVWNGTDWIEYSPTLDLSYLKDNLSVVSPTEPATGEKIWFKTGNLKEILVKNNGTYEKFYSENEIYSTNEVRIGTWIDGKPLYRQIVQGVFAREVGNQVLTSGLNADSIVNHHGFFMSNNTTMKLIPYAEMIARNTMKGFVISKNDSNELQVIRAVTDQDLAGPFVLTIEYTKITD